MLLAGQALVVEAALKVPWAQTPMYNTIMSVAAGVGLLLVVALGRELYLHRSVVAEAWALAFGVLGFLLTITGAHMSFTWPLSSIAPFDNIIFGEPSLAFGVMLVAAAVFLWSRPALFNAAVEPGDDARLIYVRRVSLPLSSASPRRAGPLRCSPPLRRNQSRELSLITHSSKQPSSRASTC